MKNLKKGINKVNQFLCVTCNQDLFVDFYDNGVRKLECISCGVQKQRIEKTDIYKDKTGRMVVVKESEDAYSKLERAGFLYKKDKKHRTNSMEMTNFDFYLNDFYKDKPNFNYYELFNRGRL